MRLRILTYNIHGARGTDGRRDYGRIGSFLKSQDIDIALIQELDTRPFRAETEKAVHELCLEHFPHFMAAPTMVNEHGWYGNAILTKYPITRHQIIDISSPHREPRNILEVFLETPEGPLHVVNTHKGLRPAERGQQLKKLHELLSKQSEVPLIVGGDVNEWQTASAAMKKLNESLHAIVCGPTFPTRWPLFRLDRMWCRPAKIFIKAQVLRTPETKLYSDHYPLLTEVQLGQGEHG